MRFPFLAGILQVSVVLACAAPANGQGAVSALRRLLESGRLPAERQGAVLEMICSRGEPDDLAVPLKFLGQPGALTPDMQRKVIDLLIDAASTRHVKPSGDLSALGKLIESPEAAKDRRLLGGAIRLAGAWKLTDVEPTLVRIVKNEENDALRQAALDGLVEIGGERSKQTIATLAGRGPSNKTRMLAVAALARLDADQAAAEAADVLAQLAASEDCGPMLDAILRRQEGSQKLAAALNGKKLTTDVAKTALRHIYSVGRSDPELSNVLSEAAGIALDAPPPSPEEASRIALEVSAKGDPVRGEKIFRRADLSCLKCHSVSQAGGSVGPDLSPIGSISPVDYIVNSILNPNLAVKEQFVTRRVLTTDGQVVTGIQIDRDDQRLRLRDATGQIVSIPSADIEQEAEGSSLMPQGLTKFLTQQEFFDLARFVSELGKPGPYAIRKTPTVQRWRVLKRPLAELTQETPNVEVIREHVLDTLDDDWRTVYGMVDGTLPLTDVTAKRPVNVFLQGTIQVTQAGPVAVHIESTEPAEVWLDAEPFEQARDVERNLGEGLHTITLRIAIGESPDPNLDAPKLKVELSRPADSAAQFVVVNGT